MHKINMSVKRIFINLNFDLNKLFYYYLNL